MLLKNTKPITFLSIVANQVEKSSSVPEWVEGQRYLFSHLHQPENDEARPDLLWDLISCIYGAHWLLSLLYSELAKGREQNLAPPRALGKHHFSTCPESLYLFFFFKSQQSRERWNNIHHLLLFLIS